MGKKWVRNVQKRATNEQQLSTNPASTCWFSIKSVQFNNFFQPIPF